MSVVNVYPAGGCSLAVVHKTDKGLWTSFDNDFYPYLLVNGERVYAKHPGDIPKMRYEYEDEGAEVAEFAIPYVHRYILDNDIRFYEDVEPSVLAYDLETYHKPGGFSNPEEDPIILASLTDERGTVVVEGGDQERLLLEYVLERFQGGYDVVVDFNGDGFDMPYFIRRCEIHGLDTGFFSLNDREDAVYFRGPSHVDLYPVVKWMSKFNPKYRLRNYTLDNVAAACGVRGKTGFDPEDIPEYLADPELKPQLIDYSRQDAQATYDIAKEFIPLYLGLSRLVGYPIDKLSRMSSGQIVETYLMRRWKQQGRGPIPRRGNSPNTDYDAALVLEPLAGLWENVLEYDFASLYPRIIIEHKVDPDGTGFIPTVVEDVMSLEAEAKSRGDKTAREALKVVRNTIYGYMGWGRSRWFNPESAEFICAEAVRRLRAAMEIAEECGLKIIYGDTDSIYVTGNMTSIKRFNRRKPDLLQYETTYKRGIFVKKKRYALLDQDGNIKARGLEVRRKDWCALAVYLQNKILRDLLEHNRPDFAAARVREAIDNMRKGDFELEDVTIRQKLGKDFPGGYKDVSKQRHTAAALRYVEKGVRAPEKDDYIYYVVCNPVGGDTSICARSWPAELVTENDVDVNYVIEGQMIKPSLRILGALGYDRAYLLDGKKQTRLD